MKTLTVIYRTGGTENAEWKRCIPVLTRAEALDLKTSCELAGYKALIHDTKALDRIGMPEGWAA